MDQQSHPAKSGTRRMLAVAAIVCLIVLVAVLMRRAYDPIVENVALSAQRATPAQKVAATPVVATPTPEATPLPTPTPEATTAAAATAPRDLPLSIRVRALTEGGCEIAADTEVSFVQIMAGGEETFVDKRALSEVSGNNAYVLEWKEGAAALAVVLNSGAVLVPVAGFERGVLDGLSTGSHAAVPIRARQVLDPTTANSVALCVLGERELSASPPTPDAGENERTLNLEFNGSCIATVILELPPDAPHTIIEDVHVFAHSSPRFFIGLPPGMRPPAFESSAIARTMRPVAFDQLSGEIRIHPLFEGEYRFRVRTSDSRIWSSETVKLEGGDERRLRVLLAPAAQITARVTGASGPSAEISYRVSGLQPPGEFSVVASKRGGSVQDAPPLDLNSRARADASVEFSGLPGGQYTVFAMESEDVRGSAFAPIAGGEHREVVIPLAAPIPVMIDIVDSSGQPWTTGASVAFRSNLPGGQAQDFEADANGRVTASVVPGSYGLIAEGSDPRTATETKVEVVAPGRGDYYRISLRNLVSLRGRVVDSAHKPIQGARIIPDERPRYSWGGPNTQATTDAKGEFTIEVAEGTLLILASHRTARVAVLTTVPLPEGELLEIVLASVSVKGVVLDRATREPVAKCNVEYSQFIGVGEFGAAWDSEMPCFGSGRARTNEKGEFELASIAPGLYSFSAHRGKPGTGGVVTEIKATGNPILELFVSETGATLSGSVVDEGGRPISDMQLSSLRTSEETPVGMSASVLTDGEGRYELHGIQEGEDMSAVFTQASYDNQPRYFLAHLAEGLNLRDGEVTTYNFTATSAARLLVSVVSVDGAAIRGAEIRLTQNGTAVPDQARLSTGPTKTDLNGQLLFRAIPAGEYVVSTQLPDGRRAESTVSLATWEYGVVTLRVE